MNQKVAYNTAKRRALEALARHPEKWWTVEEWARAAGIHPKRRMYTYAIRLAGYDLAARATIGGRLVYRIKQEGVQRLAWLRAQARAAMRRPSDASAGFA